MSEPSVSPTTCRAAARLSKQLDRSLSRVDLSMSQYRLLANLADGSAAASALAERLIVSRPSVTALVDGLVERGLVERVHAEGDRRRVIHTLTSDGQRSLSRADAAVAERLSELAADLGSADRRRAIGGLDSWSRALDSARDKVLERGQVEAGSR